MRMTLGYRLPQVLSRRLFGDRRRHGLQVREDDPDWRAWIDDHYLRFHRATQHQGVGRHVNAAGYRILRKIDLTGLRVMEIGPGELPHMAHWRGEPARYTIVDMMPEMLAASARVLAGRGVDHDAVLLPKDSRELPFASDTFDVIVSFYSLEHLYPLDRYLDELWRVLKPQGRLIGAIPAEGGLAWGLGRFVSSRRWLLRNTPIDPDKIICWEHPNFADAILSGLDQRLTSRSTTFWPLGIPMIDLNLVIRFDHVKA